MSADRAGQTVSVRTGKTGSLSRRSTRLPSTSQKVRLDTVLGLTVTSNAALAYHPATGTVAYTAGCVVVLLDPVTDTQQHLTVPNKRTLSAVAFSSDGRFLATGECGTQPCLRVWDTKESTQICELTGHKNGMTHVAFSPDLKFVISVGTQHDNLVIVWDWKTGRKVATNKVTCRVKGIAFASDGSFFVTVGNRHVKYWYLELDKDSRADVVPLVGRSAVLGDYKDECFLDVVCGRGACEEYTYAVTQSGHVCQFNSRRSLEKLTPLKSPGNCISAGETGIIVGCTNGSVRVYDPTTLTLLTTLPLPHHLGVDVAKFVSTDQLSKRSTGDLSYPDCVAIAFDEAHDRITVIYNDHSIYVWDVRDAERTAKLYSHLYHSRCVWGIDVYSPTHSSKPNLPLPIGSFVSCSSDDTVRIWSTNLSVTAQDFPTNLFCSYTQKIFYNDPTLQFLCNKEINNPGGVDPLDVHVDSKYGIRCVRFDSFGEQLAFGDRMGHIHIYQLSTMRETYKIEAHESEVLCLEYSKPDSGYELLASASRDRLIQIFDVKNDYDCLQTLDDHSSSITALRFATLNGARQFGLISCGVDKAVILRTIQYSAESGPKFLLNDQILSKGGIVYDMDIDTTSQSIVTASQDRQLRVYGIKSRKLEKTMKGSASDEGALIKLDLHESGRFIATSCSDKNLAIIDAVSGDCWAAFSGHSEIVTGLKFNQEESTLISVSGDGCVFVWKVGADGGSATPKTLTADPERFLIPLSPMNSVTSISEMSANGSDALDEELQEILQSNNGYSDSAPLPGWAKARDVPQLDSPSQDPSVPRVRGRWADEMEHVFLPDDLVGESTDSGPINSASPRITPGGGGLDFGFGNARQGQSSVASSSSGSGYSADAPKKNVALFIPFRPSSPAKPSGLTAENRSRVSSLSKPARNGKEENDLSGPGKPTPQPSIMGFLTTPRRPVKDELDDDDQDDVRPNRGAAPAVTRVLETNMADQRGSPETLPDLDSDRTGSNSIASSSSPVPSRPETPSAAATKFLNLSTAGIDKVLRSRLPHRQSITIKHHLTGPSPVTNTASTPPIEPHLRPVFPSPQSVFDSPIPRTTPLMAPSKKLIQNAKFSAHRQKFKSTQNLTMEPLTVANQSENATSNQDAGQEMRRATSMTSLHGDFKERDGMEGYNSLLERAKARLNASAAKTKTDSTPPTTGPRMQFAKPFAPPTGLSELSSAKQESPPPDISTSRSRDRRPLTGRLSVGSINSLRSRSGERSPFLASSPVTVRIPTENGSGDAKDRSPVTPIKTLLERRARESSASRSADPAAAESPTTAAIARIKAGIGLAGKTEEVNGFHSDLTMEECRQHCRNLESQTDKAVQSMRMVVETVSASPNRAEILEMYSESFAAVQKRLLDAVSILRTSDLVSLDPGSVSDPAERSRLNRLRTRVEELSRFLDGNDHPQ